MVYNSQTRAIRNARAEYSVEPAKRISASIVANEEVTQYICVSRVHLYFEFLTDESLGSTFIKPLGSHALYGF